MKNKFTKLAIPAIVIISQLLTSCTKNINNDLPPVPPVTPISKSSIDLLHTQIDISIYDSKDTAILDESFKIIDYYESILSKSEEKRSTSEIYNLNHANGETVTLSDDALECLVYGYDYSKSSNRTFDITIGALTNLWDFENGTKAPDDSLIQKALPTIDYNNIVINGNDVYLKNNDTVVDLGGIAKGYIADKVKDYLVEEGVNSAIINLGGNVLTVGYKDNENKTKFKIGISKPEISEIRTQIGYVEVNDMSVVSSGGYEQFILDKDTGIMYSHILDINTGYPVETDIAQVTILSEISADGDGLSTTCFALGIDKSLELIESLEGIECIIVSNEGDIIFSSGVGYDDNSTIKFTKTN